MNELLRFEIVWAIKVESSKDNNLDVFISLGHFLPWKEGQRSFQSIQIPRCKDSALRKYSWHCTRWKE